MVVATRIESYASSVLSGEFRWSFYESVLGKFAATIPVVGIIVNILALRHLKQQFVTEVDSARNFPAASDRIIQIFEYKNHYHCASMVRAVIECGLFLGRNTFASRFVVVIAFLDIFKAPGDISHNNKQIELIRTRGLTAAIANGLSFSSNQRS